MFTGLIEEIGTVQSIKIGGSSGRILITANKVLSDAKIGDSIAVNGVCLTVVSKQNGSFEADVMAETVRRSSLGALKSGDHVNLERAMPADGRFGGHIVSGHIDGVGTITEIRKEENAIWYTVKAEAPLLRYIVEKGSIAIDGISLTVAKVADEDFCVSIIPHTKAETILQYKQVGAVVNLECDIIGKYVERMLGFQKQEEKQSTVSMDFLKIHGYM